MLLSSLVLPMQVLLCVAIAYAVTYRWHPLIFDAGEETPSVYKGVKVAGYAFIVILFSLLSFVPDFRGNWRIALTVTLLAYIAICDIKYMVVPRQLLFMLFIIAVYVAAMRDSNVRYEHLFVMMLFYGTSRLANAIKPNAMGMADVRLFAIAGLFLGVQMSSAFFIVTYLLAFAVILPLWVLKKLPKNGQIYFTPYMCTSLFLMLVSPADILYVLNIMYAGWFG